MPVARLSEDMRWLVVFKRVYQGLKYRQIIQHLSAGPAQITVEQIRRVLRQYASSGKVVPPRRAASHAGLAQIFTRKRCRVLVGLLLDSPVDLLKEIWAKFTAATSRGRRHAHTSSLLLRRLPCVRSRAESARCRAVRSCAPLPPTAACRRGTTSGTRSSPRTTPTSSSSSTRRRRTRARSRGPSATR